MRLPALTTLGLEPCEAGDGPQLRRLRAVATRDLDGFLEGRLRGTALSTGQAEQVASNPVQVTFPAVVAASPHLLQRRSKLQTHYTSG